MHAIPLHIFVAGVRACSRTPTASWLHIVAAGVVHEIYTVDSVTIVVSLLFDEIVETHILEQAC